MILVLKVACRQGNVHSHLVRKSIVNGYLVVVGFFFFYSTSPIVIKALYIPLSLKYVTGADPGYVKRGAEIQKGGGRWLI